jgi:hypothetical protein
VILRKLESSDYYSSSSLRRLLQRIFSQNSSEAVVVANSLLSIFLDSIKEKKSGSAKQQPRTKAKCRLLKGFKMIKKHARKERISLEEFLSLADSFTTRRKTKRFHFH